MVAKRIFERDLFRCDDVDKSLKRGFRVPGRVSINVYIRRYKKGKEYVKVY